MGRKSQTAKARAAGNRRAYLNRKQRAVEMSQEDLISGLMGRPSSESMVGGGASVLEDAAQQRIVREAQERMLGGEPPTAVPTMTPDERKAASTAFEEYMASRERTPEERAAMSAAFDEYLAGPGGARGVAAGAGLAAVSGGQLQELLTGSDANVKKALRAYVTEKRRFPESVDALMKVYKEAGVAEDVLSKWPKGAKSLMAGTRPEDVVKQLKKWNGAANKSGKFVSELEGWVDSAATYLSVPPKILSGEVSVGALKEGMKEGLLARGPSVASAMEKSGSLMKWVWPAAVVFAGQSALNAYVELKKPDEVDYAKAAEQSPEDQLRASIADEYLQKQQLRTLSEYAPDQLPHIMSGLMGQGAQAPPQQEGVPGAIRYPAGGTPNQNGSEREGSAGEMAGLF